MKHTIVAIGILSAKRCYLDIPKEEAIERYRAEEKLDQLDWEGMEDTISIEEMDITDEFTVYDIWEKL